MFARAKRPTLSIDMAPLIDVVFLLLIFFMLTSSFVPPSVPLELPRAAASQNNPPPAKVIVSLDSNGQISIGETPVPLAEFGAALQSALAQNNTTSVHIRGDTSVDYGLFLELVSRARQSGANQFHLVHTPKP